MTIYLVRHGHAGRRSDWSGRDELRPLSKKGWVEAEGLAASLKEAGIVGLWSSAYTRCRQTLEPLSSQTGVPVENHGGLAEGAPASLTMGLLESHAHHPAAFCTHGDVIPRVLDALEAGGLHIQGDHHIPKGAWMELGTDGEHITSATYHPPVRD